MIIFMDNLGHGYAKWVGNIIHVTYENITETIPVTIEPRFGIDVGDIKRAVDKFEEMEKKYNKKN